LNTVSGAGRPQQWRPAPALSPVTLGNGHEQDAGRQNHPGEFRGKVAANTLWPRTAIDTAAMAEFKSHLNIGSLRSPEIMADAAHLILTSDARTVTGNFFVDDEVLATHGVLDLTRYNAPGVGDLDITPDLFVPSLLELSWERQLGSF
jgi:hypothetical protein